MIIFLISVVGLFVGGFVAFFRAMREMQEVRRQREQEFEDEINWIIDDMHVKRFVNKLNRK
ncbi:MAG: hypothetical protein PVI03_07470 [Candidatus Thorarchaeota archaeon]